MAPTPMRDDKRAAIVTGGATGVGAATAVMLARRGYVVLAPDLRCFGERLDWNPEDHYECDTNLVHAAIE